MKLWRRKRKPPAGLKGYDEVLPPEGVPLRFRIAGAGVRFSAQLADILITVLAAVALFIFFLAIGVAGPETMVAVGSMLFFLIRIPYYVITELLWNGQTLGKRFMKIKVIAADGGSLKAQALVVRNLMKEAEIFLPGTLVLTLDHRTPVVSLIAFAWVAMTLAVPLFNRRRQRLGDFIAGTFVIHLPEPVLLKDLALDQTQTRDTKERFTFLSHQLDHYGAFELQTLEDLLRAEDRRISQAAYAQRQATLAAVVEQIRRKIDFADPVGDNEHSAFLKAFYNAQRAHLEQRQLFGERRADKKHALQKGEKDT